MQLKKNKELNMHHTKDKGDLAVAKVIADLTLKGYTVYLPISEHSKADLIAENGQLYRIQVKYRADGLIPNVTSWSNKDGVHRTKYEVDDFDYYAIYLPSIDKVVYPHISYGGKCIRITEPKSSNEYYWYEDFLDIKEHVEKRYIKTSTRTNKQVVTFKRYERINWPSKEELEKLVWEKPTQQLAKELGVCDNAVGKRCKKLGIEKPPRGYWTKLKHNIAG